MNIKVENIYKIKKYDKNNNSKNKKNDKNTSKNFESVLMSTMKKGVT